MVRVGPDRAASHLKVGRAEAAKEDCSRVLERIPRNAKALFRRAQAQLALKVSPPASFSAYQLLQKGARRAAQPCCGLGIAAGGDRACCVVRCSVAVGRFQY